MESASIWREKSCKPCEGGMPKLSDREADENIRLLAGWKREGFAITRTFTFKNYHQTMAFVNAVAWIAHRENHHPDISFGYKSCTVRYTTHAIGGLSENDFICAAKIDALIG